MKVAHELAPAKQLADEAFGAGERDATGLRGGFDVVDEVDGEDAAEVEDHGRFRVEELWLVVTHGVFIGAEGGQQVLERELPHAVAVGLGAGQGEAFGRAEVVAVGGFDEGDDLFRDRVRREAGRVGNRHLALVRVAVLGVEGELAADGLGVGHQDAGVLAHAAVEAVHHVGLAGLVGAVGVEEILGGGGPGGVWDVVQLQASRLGGGEVQAELALGGRHDGERGELAVGLEFAQRLPVAFGREVIKHLDAAGGLLKREVAHVADEDDEFFLVVRPAQGLGGGFDDDDAGLVGGLLGKRPGAVRVAVVGDVNPAALGDVVGGGLVGFDEWIKDWLRNRGLPNARKALFGRGCTSTLRLQSIGCNALKGLTSTFVSSTVFYLCARTGPCCAISRALEGRALLRTELHMEMLSTESTTGYPGETDNPGPEKKKRARLRGGGGGWPDHDLSRRERLFEREVGASSVGCKSSDEVDRAGHRGTVDAGEESVGATIAGGVAGIARSTIGVNTVAVETEDVGA